MEPAALAVRELMDGFRYQADDVQDGKHGALASGQRPVGQYGAECGAAAYGHWTAR